MAKLSRSALEHRFRCRILWRRGIRFIFTTAAMLVGICLLAVVEGAVFFWLGKGYTSPTTIEQFIVWDFSLSGDGTRAVSCVSFRRAACEEAAQRAVHLHDLSGAERAAPLPCGDLRPKAAALSPTADRIALACQDGAYYLWSAPFKPRSRRRLGRTRKGVRQVVFSPDGRYLAVVTPGAVQLWSLAPRLCQRKLRHLGDAKISSTRFSADSRLMLTADESGALRLWCAESGALLREIPSRGEPLSDAALSPNGRLAAITTRRGGLYVWRVADADAVGAEK